mmetsp:Transcript_23983/g.77932  ORF Transcript_23983/g.77932 Transcript_23983/m.77932 type:complete len:340 (-) Transcript_23983:1609-2628(-)
MLEELVKVLVEVLAHQALDVLQKPVPVRVIHETVVKDAHRLVNPQPHVLSSPAKASGQTLRLLEHHPLNDARGVAQVESVVALRRRRQELVDRGAVDVERRLHDWHFELNDLLRETVQLHIPPENGGEDALERVRVKVDDADGVEVPHVSSGDGVAPAPGRPAGAHELHIHHLAELVLAVVPPAVVHVLPKQLDRGLRAIHFQGWHVEIVNHDDLRLARRGSVDALAALVEFRVDEVLSHVGRGARGEGDKVWREMLRQAAHEMLGDVRRLAGTRRPDEQAGLVVLDELVEQEGVALCVDRRDDDLAELSVVRDLHILHHVGPVLPRPFLEVPHIVVDV